MKVKDRRRQQQQGLEAKIGGMTPEVLIFSGRKELSPPYMRLPTWRLGYWTSNPAL